MATPKTGKPRGRPKGPDLRSHPLRHAVALAVCLRDKLGTSERKAFDLAAGVASGEEVDPRDISAPEGLMHVSYRTPHTTIGGHASTIRKLANGTRTDAERIWLEFMVGAFWIVLTRKNGPSAASEFKIQTYACAAGEAVYFRLKLLPMYRAKFLPNSFRGT